MFASTLKDRARRRGVVLVVILGMLGLLALIGVTFAAFSGQAQINARNYMNAQNFPDSSEMMDYALSQLIDDTSNPSSVIRGHSVKRDMYGNDAGYNAAFLNGKPDGSDYIYFTNVSLMTTGTYTGYVQCVTNLALNDPQFYQFPNGAFSRWVVRFAPKYQAGLQYHTSVPAANTYVVGQTHEIIVDDATGATNNSYRVFYLPPPDPFVTFTQPVTPLQPLPSTIAQITGYTSYETAATASLLYPGLPPTNTAITMDGRYLRAFNGPGLAALGADGTASNTNPPHPLTEYANFRYNGNVLLNALLKSTGTAVSPSPAYGDPNYTGDTYHYGMPGMDEDYDAADLENWFLSIQSADGNVVIPSFHRPGILTADDWANTGVTLAATRSMSKILRPRAIDGHNPISFPDLVPDSTGRITYDVDNDGDRVTDAVWLDLGYPSLMNTEGQLYKPLFAFTVIGLNGKLPLNTAGNLQNISQIGEPQFTHASHLGYSPSEIDITFALQNAYLAASPATYSQTDNAGVDVRLTQARNLLTGTRLPDSTFDPNAASPGTPTDNGDINYVVVNNRRVVLPNNMYDANDSSISSGTTSYVSRQTTAIPGRWGEEGGVPSSLPAPVTPATIGPFNNTVRAGLSYVNGGGFDVRDDNYNTFDMFPTPASGENADYYDASGGLSFPVERIRRFVYPLDVWGDGRITTYGSNSRELGGDLFGRVSFFHYFRPPGVLIASNGLVSPHQPATIGNSPATPNQTNNPLHGFESQRNPFATTGFNANPNGLPSSLFLAAMPSDMPSGTMTSGGPATVPTYSASINSNAYFVSPGLNEADEMKIFEPTVYDAPFGPADIAWLYRYQDVDGGSLHSRLANLAPISFLNPADGTRRRRLFSLDTFDTTNFVWANDNPSGVFPNNSHFSQLGNASMAGINTNTPQIAQRDRRINLNFPLPVSNSPIEPIRQKWIRDTYRMLKAVLPPKSVDTPEELAQLSQYVVNIVDFRDPDGTCTRFVNTDVEEIPPTAGPAGLPATIRMAVNAPTAHGAYDTNWKESTRNTDGSIYLVQYGMEHSPVAINEVLAYQFNTKKSNASIAVQRMFIEVVNTLVQDASGAASSLDLTGWDWVVMQDDNVGRPDPYTGQIPAQPTIAPNSYGNIWPYYLNGKQAMDRTTGATYQPGGTMTTLIPALNAVNGTAADNATNYYYIFGNALLDSTTTWVANPVGSSPKQLGDANGTLIETNGSAPTTTPFTAPGLLGDSTPAGTPSPTNSIDNWINNPTGGSYPTAYPSMKENNYYWLYLRRPANPFDLSMFDYNNPNENRVVVDCFRFIFLKATTTGTTDTTMSPPVDTVNPTTAADYLFSLQRMQPYRGGHAIKPLNDPNMPAVLPAAYVNTAYGYSEQTTVAPSAASGQIMYGMYGNKKSTGEIFHSLGKPNNSGNTTSGPTPVSDSYWDWVPFHDRDFMSPAELTLVPGCPPGLFTKQFVELAPPIVGTTNYKDLTVTERAAGGWGATASTTGFWNTSTQWPAGTSSWLTFKDVGAGPLAAPHTFPYLTDELFYTGANEPTVTATNITIWPEPTPTTGPHPPHNYTNGNLVGGPSGAGWGKMLEFFEVPSPAFGAVGPVASGSNYDWLRQDLRPGLINMNLVIDEEVFLGLMGPNFYRVMNQVQVGAAQTPAVVTQVEPTAGAPTAKINLNGANGVHGYLDNYTVDGGTQTFGNNLKAAFSDFLKLTHGGSGYLFSYGRGQTGQNGQPVTTGTTTTQTPVAPSRPFHTLSYPDIDYTVFRPAALPPSLYTTPTDAAASNGGALPAFNTAVVYGTPAPNATGMPYAQDPGVKSPYFYTANNPVQPPPIPPRRLFQIPDWYGSARSYTINTSPTTPDYPSNAASVYYANATVTYSGDPRLNSQTRDPNLANPMADLSAVPNTDASNNIQNVVYLGIPSVGGSPTDHRDHPYFRNEWLQRVSNLTTVRTHQYAVWITVGFFEVTQQGDPLLATTDPTRAYDILGLEIGALDGKNIRYRSFFLVDRTRATGFNPAVPDDFRNMVVYRQSIE